MAGGGCLQRRQRTKSVPVLEFCEKSAAAAAPRGGEMRYQAYRGQLRLSVYVNSGLLTVHVKEARQLRSARSKQLCHSYVKMSLSPDESKRTKCKTEIVPNTNIPKYNEKFSFELLSSDSRRRLVVSMWNKDNKQKQCELLGCMSFGIRHIMLQKKAPINGWYYLLNEHLGKKKHLQVSGVDLDESDLYMDMAGIDIPHASDDSGHVQNDASFDSGRGSGSRQDRKRQQLNSPIKKIHLSSGRLSEASPTRHRKLGNTRDIHKEDSEDFLEGNSREFLEGHSREFLDGNPEDFQDGNLARLKGTISEHKAAIHALKEKVLQEAGREMMRRASPGGEYPGDLIVSSSREYLGSPYRECLGSPLPIVSSRPSRGQQWEDGRCPLHDQHEPHCPVAGFLNRSMDLGLEDTDEDSEDEQEYHANCELHPAHRNKTAYPLVHKGRELTTASPLVHNGREPPLLVHNHREPSPLVHNGREPSPLVHNGREPSPLVHKVREPSLLVHNGHEPAVHPTTSSPLVHNGREPTAQFHNYQEPAVTSPLLHNDVDAPQVHRQIITVSVTRGEAGFGLSLAGERPARVLSVMPGSSAHQAGLLPNDHLLRIGDADVSSLSSDTVARVIRHSTDHITLEIGRQQTAPPTPPHRGSSSKHAAANRATTHTAQDRGQPAYDQHVQDKSQAVHNRDHQVQGRSHHVQDRGHQVQDRVQPVQDRGQPVQDRGQPVQDKGHPVPDRGYPVQGRGQPVQGRGQPVQDRGQPLQDRGQPVQDRGPPMQNRDQDRSNSLNARGHLVADRVQPVPSRGHSMNGAGQISENMVPSVDRGHSDQNKGHLVPDRGNLIQNNSNVVQNWGPSGQVRAHSVDRFQSGPERSHPGPSVQAQHRYTQDNTAGWREAPTYQNHRNDQKPVTTNPPKQPSYPSPVTQSIHTIDSRPHFSHGSPSKQLPPPGERPGPSRPYSPSKPAPGGVRPQPGSLESRSRTSEGESEDGEWDSYVDMSSHWAMGQQPNT